MTITRVNGIGLYVEEHGSGPPIVCIHGTSSSALVWGDAAKELAKRGRCITYDRRGCYRSERPEPYDRTDVREHADDAAALIDGLGAAPAIVIGRSYGGETALDLARRHPAMVSALVLLEPTVLALDDEARTWGMRLRDEIVAVAERDMAAVGEAFLRRVVGDDSWESFPDGLKAMFTGNGPAILAELRGDWIQLDAGGLTSVTQPTLVVSAKDSPAPFRRADSALVDVLPNVQHTTVEGGHLINPAHPAVLAHLDALIRQP